MIQPRELRIGNLLLWNSKLVNPVITLPPTQVEVFSILQDKISYVLPNIENRVEPFEDVKAQMGTGYIPFEELEPIILTAEILENVGFEGKRALVGSKYFEKGDLQLKQHGEHFHPVSVEFKLHIKYFHQLQNLYFALTGDELETKIHGQQS